MLSILYVGHICRNYVAIVCVTYSCTTCAYMYVYIHTYLTYWFPFSETCPFLFLHINSRVTLTVNFYGYSLLLTVLYKIKAVPMTILLLVIKF